MTDTIEASQLHEALALIERGLGDLQRRELVSSAEVADLLLDLRGLLIRRVPGGEVGADTH